MKYLLDANLSRHMTRMLGAAGFEATHVIEHDLLTATDERIAEFAEEHDLCVISADSDFATLLALGRGKAPSLVLLRSLDRLTPAEQAAVLIANLPALQDELSEGAVASIGAGHIRVRTLPLR